MTLFPVPPSSGNELYAVRSVLVIISLLSFSYHIRPQGIAIFYLSHDRITLHYYRTGRRKYTFHRGEGGSDSGQVGGATLFSSWPRTTSALPMSSSRSTTSPAVPPVSTPPSANLPPAPCEDRPAVYARCHHIHSAHAHIIIYVLSSYFTWKEVSSEFSGESKNINTCLRKDSRCFSVGFLQPKGIILNALESFPKCMSLYFIRQKRWTLLQRG